MHNVIYLLTALWNRNRAKCLQNFSSIVDPCTGDIAASNLPEAFRTASVFEEVCNGTCIRTKLWIRIREVSPRASYCLNIDRTSNVSKVNSCFTHVRFHGYTGRRSCFPLLLESESVYWVCTTTTTQCRWTTPGKQRHFRSFLWLFFGFQTSWFYVWKQFLCKFGNMKFFPNNEKNVR